MYEIDRVVAIIKPTEKMLSWLKQQTSEFAELTLDDIRADCTALLIPAFDDPDMAEQYIEEIFPAIFENELELWVSDEEHWPHDRSLEMFNRWFNIEFHSMVFDLGNAEDMEQEVQYTRLQ